MKHRVIGKVVCIKIAESLLQDVPDLDLNWIKSMKPLHTKMNIITYCDQQVRVYMIYFLWNVS